MMTEDTPLEKTLKEIEAKKAYDELAAFIDPQSWLSMTANEKELLAALLLQVGELRLKQANSEGSFSFARKLLQAATALTPASASTWYRRGLASLWHDDLASLEEACLCFEKATNLEKGYFDAWYAWASALMNRGAKVADLDYAMQAKEKFEQAERILQEPLQEPFDSFKTFFWHYGLAWFTIGRFSGEASDFHESLRLFRKAKNLGLSQRDFYNDFGNALVALSVLINNQEMLLEAIEWYLLSLDCEGSRWESDAELAMRYCNLGGCYQHIFEKTGHEEAFNSAQNAFRNALKYNAKNFNAWLLWAILELFAAKLWQSVEHLECSLNMFHKANQMHSDHPLLLARWSEAESLYGYHEENLPALYKAEAMAEKCLEIAPHLSGSVFAYCLVLYQLGRYFTEKNYFQKCRELAEKALIVHPEDGNLWHILAVAKFSLAETLETGYDFQLLEECLACFQQAAKSTLSRMSCFWNDWGIALLSIAESTHDLKHIHDAIEKFEQAIIQQEPTSFEGLIHYANALDLLGDVTDDPESYERAIQVLSHVTINDPENSSARYQLAMAWNHLGELNSDGAAYQKAASELEKVVEIDPEDDQAWADLGLSLLHIAELFSEPESSSEARQVYTRARGHFMKALALGNQLVYYHLACLCTFQGEYKEAVQFLEKAFESELLPPIEEILDDDWLEPLVNTPHFQMFLERLSNNA
jgi:tetratricopeptide (TPR) repeat protein